MRSMTTMFGRLFIDPTTTDYNSERLSITFTYAIHHRRDSRHRCYDGLTAAHQMVLIPSKDARATVIRLPETSRRDPDWFFDFCQVNEHLQVERNAQGEIQIMAPPASEIGYREGEAFHELRLWAGQDGTGIAFNSNTGFVLPNGANRSPDAAWVKRSSGEIVCRTKEEIPSALSRFRDRSAIALRPPGATSGEDGRVSRKWSVSRLADRSAATQSSYLSSGPTRGEAESSEAREGRSRTSRIRHGTIANLETRFLDGAGCLRLSEPFAVANGIASLPPSTNGSRQSKFLPYRVRRESAAVAGASEPIRYREWF